MKLQFDWVNDGNIHTYCISCHSETVRRLKVEGKTQYYCKVCKRMYDRWIKIDPNIVWWIDNDGEYWHESVGVFVCNNEGKFLFFQRNVFPFSLTVPSGHVDRNESPAFAADRELQEEVGLEGSLLHIADENILGDSCSMGSDVHRWHAFLLQTNGALQINVKEEGDDPMWLTLEEALAQELTVPVRHIIVHYRELLDTRAGELTSD